MAKYQLSVVLSAMRTHRWMELYESIRHSFHGTWEIIFVGPYTLPTVMEKFDNVKCIIDKGSISRCQQIAIEHAEGEYLTWTADDGVFIENKLDKAFDVLKTHNYDKKTVIVGKYTEGLAQGLYHPHMNSHDYYLINFHDAIRNQWVRYDCYLLNMTVINTELVKELGGLDCRFEACALAFVDFSMRAYFYGIKPVFVNDNFYMCDHMKGEEGDHAPIHNAQTKRDMPLFTEIWLGDKKPDRTIIQFDNWKQAPKVWEERFGKEKSLP